VKKIKLQIIALMVVVGFAGFAGSAFAAPGEQKEVVVPPPQIDAEWSQQNQALVDLVKDNKTDEALQKALAMFQYLQGKKLMEGQEAATTYNNLGMIYLSKGQFDKAQANLLKALEMRSTLYGPNSVDVATVWLNLSQLYKLQAEYIFQLNKKKTEGETPQAVTPTAAEKKEAEKKDDAKTQKAAKKTKKK